MLTNTSITALFAPGEHALHFQGPAGLLEAVILCPQQYKQSVAAVICHPNPLHGGTMNNKVVTTIARAFRDAGIASVRFNFRGVGNSAGQYADGVGESEDLQTILQMIKQQYPDIKLCLAGFSFGSYVAYRVAPQWPLAVLISVAPPVQLYDLTDLPVPQCPWIVVQGEQDDIVPPATVYTWLQSLTVTPKLIRFPQAGHFFHGQLTALKAQLQAQLMTVLQLP